MLTFDWFWATTKPQNLLIWLGLNRVERLVCQGSLSSFPTASFMSHRSAWLIPAIHVCLYASARDTLVTLDDVCPTSSDRDHDSNSTSISPARHFVVSCSFIKQSIYMYLEIKYCFGGGGDLTSRVKFCPFFHLELGTVYQGQHRGLDGPECFT